MIPALPLMLVLATQDPHAGHVMPPAAIQTAPAQPADPHAGHAMEPQSAPDPHAGHRMATTPDPHAGHDMSAMAAPPSSSALSTTPPPASGPTHAADAIFGSEAMAASRRVLMLENGDVRTTGLVIDRAEVSTGDEGEEGYLWDVQGWTGGDIHRLWWKSEGEGAFGDDLHDAEIQLLYGRAMTPFWDVQAGLRQDIRPDGDDTTHLVLGVQGLAPHWWEVDAAAFLSGGGDLTARVEAEYDQRITQKLILQPRFEIAAAAQDSTELEVDAGVTSIAAGLRLRYEIRRELAPYIGVEWSRVSGMGGEGASLPRPSFEDTRLVVGIRAWF